MDNDWEEEAFSEWPAIAELMTVLALIFLLIFILYAALVSATPDNETLQTELEGKIPENNRDDNNSQSGKKQDRNNKCEISSVRSQIKEDIEENDIVPTIINQNEPNEMVKTIFKGQFLFDNNAAGLNTAFENILKVMSGALFKLEDKCKGKLAMKIVGHASSNGDPDSKKGNDQNNMTLSEDRAKSVGDYLDQTDFIEGLDLSIETETIKIEGQGENCLIGLDGKPFKNPDPYSSKGVLENEDPDASRRIEIFIRTKDTKDQDYVCES